MNTKHINLEKDANLHIKIGKSFPPIDVPRSNGWYLLPVEHGSDGKPKKLVWHLGRRWEASNHSQIPKTLRGVQTVIEFCQGGVALTGLGAGVPDWHGPFEEPNDDHWAETETEIKTCEICVKIDECLKDV